MFGQLGAAFFGVDGQDADVYLAEGALADVVGKQVLLAADCAARGERVLLGLLGVQEGVLGGFMLLAWGLFHWLCDYLIG